MKDKRIQSRKTAPGTTTTNGRGGSSIAHDTNGNIILTSNNKPSSSQTDYSMVNSISSIGIFSGEPPIGIQSEVVFPSSNFTTLGWSQTATDQIIPSTYTQPYVVTQSTNFETAIDVTSSIITSPEIVEIINYDTASLTAYFAEVEPTDDFFTIYGEDIPGTEIPPEVWTGISPKEQESIKKSSGNSSKPGTPSPYNSPGNLNINQTLSSINSFPSLKKLSPIIKGLAAAQATVEGFNSQGVKQNHNPGNLRGKGDLGSAAIKGAERLGTYANFSTYEKGWTAMINQITLPYINGTAKSLNYDGGVRRINWYIIKDNEYYKKNGINYKEQTSYSHKGTNPPTFRQYFNTYAPFGDGNTNPTTYLVSVVKALIANNLIPSTVNIDEPMNKYIK
jgi:hypothetical protein